MTTQAPSPFFSIITVTFNAEAYVEETLKSIVGQTFRDFELLVIDGRSSDQTLPIVNRYREHITELVVEPDQGIYDAMNKGIRLARGKYINFMNAGDTFYADHTLHQVHRAIEASPSRVDIGYGKVVNISSEQSNYRYATGKPISRRSYFLSTPMCHQTMFTEASLFDKVGLFSLERGIGAFYDWLGAYYAYRKTLDRILFIPECIACYLMGGYSFQMMRSINRERVTTARKYFSLKYRIYNYVLYLVTLVKTEVLMLMTRYDLLDRYRRFKYGLLQRSA